MKIVLKFLPAVVLVAGLAFPAVAQQPAPAPKAAAAPAQPKA